MRSQLPFIGRKKQLEEIRTLINAQGSYRIAFIDAPGGFGKTRLLNKVSELYKDENPNLFVTDIIDFDDRALNSPDNLALKMTKRIGLTHFEEYYHLLKGYFAMQRGGGDTKRLEEERQKIQETWYKEFNIFSEETRVVYLFDTLDNLRSKDALNYMKKHLSSKKANNVLFLIAGRNIKENPLYEDLGNDNTHIIELEGFEPEDSEKYTKDKQNVLYSNLNPELTKKILWLAEGKPILLDLAITWLSREVPPKWLVDIELLSDSQLHKNREKFEEELMKEITVTDELRDWLIITLSRVYPLNVDMIGSLLSLSENIAEELFKEVQNDTIIKKLPNDTISLHDEIRRMVNAYVWPKIDPNGERQQRESKIAVKLFEEQIKNVQKRIKLSVETKLEDSFKQIELVNEKNVLIIRQIEHTLHVNIEEGFNLWKKRIELARKEIGFAKQLLDIFQEQEHKNKLNENNKFELEVMKCRLLSDIRQYDKSQKRLEELLTDNKDHLKKELNIRNALGVAKKEKGLLTEALKEQLKCLNIMEELGDEKFFPHISNQVAIIYQLLGEWSNALIYSKKAYIKAMSEENKNLYIIADILNNWGDELSMTGDHDEGILSCKKAIKIWKSLDKKSSMVGEGELVLGMIYRRKGDFRSSIEYLKKTIAHFRGDDYRAKDLVKAHSELGFVYHIMEDRDSFPDAQQYLETGYKLAKKYALILEIPLLLGRLARMYWSLGEKDKAREKNREAYEEAKKINRGYAIFKSILGDAEFDWEEDKYDKIDDYAEQMKNELGEKQKDLSLFWGRMRRIQGAVAIITKNKDKALDYYEEALSLISITNGYGRYSLEREIDDLSNIIIKHLSYEEAKAWYTSLKERLEKRKEENNNISHLIEELDISNAIQFSNFEV